MKRSTIATTALALAASVFAGSAIADAVTVTNVFENFSALSGINNVTTNNLTWNTDGADNLSGISNINANAKLYLDTGTNGLVTATIAEAATTNVAAATSAESASVYATFSAKVAFYPATVAPPINDDNQDLKFALYAFVDNNNETNLYAIGAGGTAASTGVPIDSTSEKDVVVTFTSNNFFRVSVDGHSSGDIGFKNNGQISKVEFQGNGTVDDVTIAYTSALDNQEPISIGGDVGSAESHKLTESEAGYLNNLVKDKGLSVVENALKGINEETFEKASLLNLDVTAEGVSNAVASADFKITSIKRSGTDVYVSVKLVRNGDILGKVNGTVALYTCDTPNGEYTQQATFTAALESNASTAEATNKFTGVSKSFFQVKIVDDGAVTTEATGTTVTP